jgi:hypothetical protein
MDEQRKYVEYLLENTGCDAAMEKWRRRDDNELGEQFGKEREEREKKLQKGGGKGESRGKKQMGKGGTRKRCTKGIEVISQAKYGI